MPKLPPPTEPPDDHSREPGETPDDSGRELIDPSSQQNPVENAHPMRRREIVTPSIGWVRVNEYLQEQIASRQQVLDLAAAWPGGRITDDIHGSIYAIARDSHLLSDGSRSGSNPEPGTPSLPISHQQTIEAALVARGIRCDLNQQRDQQHDDEYIREAARAYLDLFVHVNQQRGDAATLLMAHLVPKLSMLLRKGERTEDAIANVVVDATTELLTQRSAWNPDRPGAASFFTYAVKIATNLMSKFDKGEARASKALAILRASGSPSRVGEGRAILAAIEDELVHGQYTPAERAVLRFVLRPLLTAEIRAKRPIDIDALSKHRGVKGLVERYWITQVLASDRVWYVSSGDQRTNVDELPFSEPVYRAFLRLWNRFWEAVRERLRIDPNDDGNE